MQVSREGLALHLTEHHGDCCPGPTVFVRASGLEAYHAELIAKRYGYSRPGLEVAPWGAKETEAIDPFGNRLRFSEDLGGREPRRIHARRGASDRATA